MKPSRVWVPAALLLAGGLLLCCLCRTPLLLWQAERLLERGEGAAARAVYEKLDSPRAAEGRRACDLLEADALYAAGDWSGAQALYERLPEDPDARRKALLCRYRLSGGEDGTVLALYDGGESEQALTYIRASELFVREEWEEAAGLFESLGDFSRSRERLERCREELYKTAVAAMERRDFAAAAETFRLTENYEKSALYGAYCRLRLERAGAESEPVATEDALRERLGSGALYYSRGVYVYVPDEPDQNTRFLLYFSGGDGMVTLYEEGMRAFLEGERPNAVCLFKERSGYPDMEGAGREMLAMSEQLAAETGLLFRDPVLIGSSSGAYTAMHAAALFFQEGFVPAASVLTIDTGQSWGETERLMTAEEREAAAQAGTRFYLFEQRGTGTQLQPIRDLVESGSDVTAVYCEDGDHESMNRRVFFNGSFSWALGQRAELDPAQYRLVPLTAEEEP